MSQVPSKPTATGAAQPGVWAAFRAGATQPSAAGLVGMVVVALVLFVAVMLLLTPARLARLDPQVLMTVPDDDYALLTIRALRVAQKEPAPFAVAYFGSSDAAAAVSDKGVIEQAVSQRLGQPVPLYFLACKQQKFLMVANLLEQVGHGFNGIVVVSMGPFHMAQTQQAVKDRAEDERFALGGPVFDAELKRTIGTAPRRTGVYFLDHWRFFAARMNPDLVRTLIFGPPRRSHSRNWYIDRPAITDEQMANVLARTKVSPEAYYENRDRNAAILDRAVQRLRQGGRVEVVLVEQPFNPAVVNQIVGPDILAEHYRYMQQWADARHMHYWGDVNEEAGLTPQDYYDHVHIASPAARDRYTQVIAQRLARLAASMHDAKETP